MTIVANTQRIEAMEQLARAAVALDEASRIVADIPGDGYIASRIKDLNHVTRVMSSMLREKVQAE